MRREWRQVDGDVVALYIGAIVVPVATIKRDKARKSGPAWRVNMLLPDTQRDDMMRHQAEAQRKAEIMVGAWLLTALEIVP